MPAAAELLRPPSHRGPLIAAGAVLLTLGLGLVELRLGERIAAGLQVLFLAAASALVLGLGLQARNEEGRPPAFKSVLLVCGLLLLAAALLRLGQAVGADVRSFPAGTLVWTGALLTLAAGWVAARSGSAICALIAAVAAGGTVIEAVRWIFHPSSFTPSRWLLLGFAVVLVLLALWLRGSRPRHAELLIDVAALAVLAIALQALVGSIVASLFPFGGGPVAPLSGFWELVVLAAGCGLLAYGAIDGAPGPAWLGAANLLAFLAITTVGHDGLLWWPLVLLAGGLGVIAAGLRPRTPLPPEPDAYRSGETPLASRTETVLRVRDERPPTG
jgi:hypothetical protein